MDITALYRSYTHIIRGPNDVYVIHAGQDSSGKARANAALIVKCVNRDHVFEELVHLCKWTLAVLDEEKWNTSLQAELRIALSKASKLTRGLLKRHC